MSLDLQRDKFAIRKDVMILRQVVYKELCTSKIEALKITGFNLKEGHKVIDILALSESEKAWIDTQVTWFFSEIPEAVMQAYRNEFSSKGGAVPSKVADTDLVPAGGVL